MALSRKVYSMNIFKGAKRLVTRRWEELGWEGKRPSPSGKAQVRRRHLIKL